MLALGHSPFSIEPVSPHSFRYAKQSGQNSRASFARAFLLSHHISHSFNRFLKNELNASQSEQRGTAAKQKTAVFVAIKSASDLCILTILKYTLRGISIRLASPVSPAMINERKYLTMAFPRKLL